MDKSRLKMMNLRHEWIYGLRIRQIDRPVDGWIDRQTDRQITKKSLGTKRNLLSKGFYKEMKR